MATLSNCGELLKLLVPSQPGNRQLVARVMTSGMVKTKKMQQWTIRIQALTLTSSEVRHGEGSETKWQWVPTQGGGLR
jgi:hypothetical protein